MGLKNAIDRLLSQKHAMIQFEIDIKNYHSSHILMTISHIYNDKCKVCNI